MRTNSADRRGRSRGGRDGFASVMIAAALIAAAVTARARLIQRNQAGRKPLPEEESQCSQSSFRFAPRGREPRWVVRLGDSLYGTYLDKESALLDAVDAARDAVEAGYEAQVWIKDRSAAARVF